MPLQSQHTGSFEGKDIRLYTFTNANGSQVQVTNYGGIVSSWICADKQGNHSDIVIGLGKPENYIQGHPYFGCLVGRYANRIANGRFSLNGKTYNLSVNNGPNHLHGGVKGFDKAVWNAETAHDSLLLRYVSPDGEEGYPGNLTADVRYSYSDENELKIQYRVTTDADTPVCLTNHSYFNLSGDLDRGILDHSVWIDADHYTPVNEVQIPTGEIAPVAGTAFDFRIPSKTGARIAATEGGYDHNFVLNKRAGNKAAELKDAHSGRLLEVFTDLPGLQFYSGNFLDGTLTNAAGKTIRKHSGVCFESQFFPDSPNQPGFPDAILKAGETWESVTSYKVSLYDL
ncbi:aldose epimerase family protein [Sediminibacterium ginsengisoli]|uniref:Aldose 1-epimerase n=1 Tax=Sediminibacterium ginsengisoli TaxID=413434 RepID=A0A1T4ND14_9BACT|nr:aldose epimerase family protein [Sediminibacterium ginsengisoli]SJZ77179.1 aldose 1-epimerase [Sediminibacterium ginsengisoli]